MQKLLIQALILLITMIATVSCNRGTLPSEPAEIRVAEKSDFEYLVEMDDSPDIKVSGPEFQVTTNNCGARSIAQESFTRSREFNVSLDAEFSETARGQLGGDILVVGAEVETAVGVRLGLRIGSKESIQTERKIETPADSITTVTLQWEEIWQAGNVSILRNDGAKIGDVPFRVLTTMRLTQTAIRDTPCGTLTITESQPLGGTDVSGEVTPVPSPFNTSAISTNIPILTVTPTPSSTPTIIPTPSPTATPEPPTHTPTPPPPTNTPVPPTPTPLPPTNTPVPPTFTPVPTNTPVPSTNTPIPTPSVFSVSVPKASFLGVVWLCRSKGLRADIAANKNVTIHYVVKEGVIDDVSFAILGKDRDRNTLIDFNTRGNASYEYNFNSRNGGNFRIDFQSCNYDEDTLIEVTINEGIWYFD